MRLDSKHALRHVLCLPNLSAMQGAKWVGVSTILDSLRRVVTWFVVTLFAVWLGACSDSPADLPSLKDIAGEYFLTAASKSFLLKQQGYGKLPESKIHFAANGTIEFLELPDCAVNGFGDSSGKFLSGSGKWELENTDWGYGITAAIERGGTMERRIYHAS